MKRTRNPKGQLEQGPFHIESVSMFSSPVQFNSRESPIGTQVSAGISGFRI